MGGRRARRRAIVLVACGGSAALVACNLITGEHDRFLAPATLADGSPATGATASEAGPLPGEAGLEAAVPDSGFDAAPILIPIAPNWATPNSAQIYHYTEGTFITPPAGPLTPEKTHPVIIPSTPVGIPGSDYTVIAAVLVTDPVSSSEFGVLLRLEDVSGVVFGSNFGGGRHPFLANMGAPGWTPTGTTLQYGSEVPTAAGADGGSTHFKMVAQARGEQISAKIWNAAGPEPGFQIVYPTPLRGRGIGFYTYNTVTVYLEELRVTVP